MKKFLMTLLAAASTFIMTGCADSPEEVVQNWGNAIISGDKAAADKLLAPGTDARINEFFIQGYKNDKHNQDSFKNAFENIGKAEVNGDSAKIEVAKLHFSLKKVDGKWKISIK